MITIVGILIGFLILMPIITFIHELGHAVSFLLSGHSVKIVIGNPTKIYCLDLGKLQLLIAPFSLWFGFVECLTVSTKKQEIQSAIMGPIASFIMCVCLFFLSHQELSPFIIFIISFCFYGTLIQFILTSIPIYYPRFFGYYSNTPSDGRRLFELLGLAKQKTKY